MIYDNAHTTQAGYEILGRHDDDVKLVYLKILSEDIVKNLDSK